MTLSCVVTKKSVSYVQPKLHNITFNLILKEDTTEVLNKDFSCQFFTGDNPSTKTTQIIKDMQEIIDQYKAQKVIFDSTALNNAVTSIQGGLSL
jgi:hypothetical protein